MRDQDFTYHTTFGRQFTYRYTDITNLEVTENMVHMVVGKKNFWIDSHALGVDHFMDRVNNHTP